MSFGQRVARAGRRIWKYRFLVPLTPLGFGVICVATWVLLHYGRAQMDFVLYAAALIAFLLVGTAIAMVLFGALILALWLRHSGTAEALCLESGIRAATGFRFPRFCAWPMVQIRLQWVDPDDVEVTTEISRGDVQEVVVPQSRGVFSELERRFVVADIFGLARFGVHRTDKHPVRITPSSPQVTGNAIMHFVRGEGLSHPSGPAAGELLDMRRYSYGDPLRHLLWKAYARTRQLLVRTVESAIVQNPSTSAYFVAGPGDEATAGMARFFVEQGLLGDDFVFCADGAADPTSDRGQAVDQIIRSVNHRAVGGIGLARFLERNAERVGRGSLVLFVPPMTGEWLARVESLASHMVKATVILAIDGDVSAERRGLVQRLLFSERDQLVHGLGDVPQLVGRLAQRGLRARVLHRPTGELVATRGIEALA